mgnify:CR=1 FL=1
MISRGLRSLFLGKNENLTEFSEFPDLHIRSPMRIIKMKMTQDDENNNMRLKRYSHNYKRF